MRGEPSSRWATDPGASSTSSASTPPAVPTRELADKTAGAQATTERAYRAELVDQQAGLKASIAKITGEAPAKVRFSYTEAINGIAVELTRAEALRVPGRRRLGVQVDRPVSFRPTSARWIGAAPHLVR